MRRLLEQRLGLRKVERVPFLIRVPIERAVRHEAIRDLPDAEQDRLDQGLLIGGIIERLAHLDIVERRLANIDDDEVVEGRSPLKDLDITVLGKGRHLAERHSEDDAINLPALQLQNLAVGIWHDWNRNLVELR